MVDSVSDIFIGLCVLGSFIVPGPMTHGPQYLAWLVLYKLAAKYSDRGIRDAPHLMVTGPTWILDDTLPSANSKELHATQLNFQSICCSPLAKAESYLLERDWCWLPSISTRIISILVRNLHA